ncbi:hypothetical protein J7M00_06650 [bacterium]|nr:hypothetical protein [bacterium]
MRIYGRRKVKISANAEDEDEKKLVRLGRVDRSRYPKGTFWIIFAACGALLLWMIMKFFLLLTQ